MEKDIQFEILEDYLVWSNLKSGSASISMTGYDSKRFTLNSDVVTVKFDEVLYGFKSIPELNSIILISKTEVSVLKLGSNDSKVSLNEIANLPFKEVENEIIQLAIVQSDNNYLMILILHDEYQLVKLMLNT